jgi:hypothetical protein
MEASMISDATNRRRKGIILGAVAIAAVSLCAATPADAYGWHGGGWGWHGGWGWRGGWGWAGPGIGIGFGYYPGAYAYAPPVYYAPPPYYGPPAYYRPTAFAVTQTTVHKTVRHHVHKTTAQQVCPVPQSAPAPQSAPTPQSGAPAPSNSTTRSDY